MRLNDTVGMFYNKPNLTGSRCVGLEIEMEAHNMFPDSARTQYYWKKERDGSLRGRASIEYVLRRPMSRGGIDAALNKLDSALAEERTEVIDSVRAGIHVHINVRDLTILQMITMVTYYYILEELLVATMCGEGRSGNHFCLRVKDADYILSNLTEAIQKRRFGYLDKDIIRYSALNFCSLNLYGSLEFRAMRTTRDFTKIKEWVDVLLAIKKNSSLSPNPRHVLENFSFGGEWNFLKDILGEGLAKEIVKRDPGYKEKLNNGARLAQEVGYALDNWEDTEKRVDGQVL